MIIMLWFIKIMKKLRNQLIKWFQDIIQTEIKISTSVLVILGLIVCIPSLFIGIYISNIKDILVELHGAVFDIVIFGILILFLNTKRERKILIRKYHDEIDNFRGWDAQEAAYRTLGSIKRLNEIGITKMNLLGCNLNKMDFRRYQDFLKSNSEDYIPIDFTDSDMRYIKLKGTSCIKTIFRNCKFSNAEMMDADFNQADFQGADLFLAELSGSNLYGANFLDAVLHESDLTTVKNLKPGQLLKAKTLFKSKLDPKIKEAIKKERPYLFEPDSLKIKEE